MHSSSPPSRSIVNKDRSKTRRGPLGLLLLLRSRRMRTYGELLPLLVLVLLELPLLPQPTEGGAQCGFAVVVMMLPPVNNRRRLPPRCISSIRRPGLVAYREDASFPGCAWGGSRPAKIWWSSGYEAPSPSCSALVIGKSIKGLSSQRLLLLWESSMFSDRSKPLDMESMDAKEGSRYCCITARRDDAIVPNGFSWLRQNDTWLLCRGARLGGISGREVWICCSLHSPTWIEIPIL